MITLRLGWKAYFASDPSLSNAKFIKYIPLAAVSMGPIMDLEAALEWLISTDD